MKDGLAVLAGTLITGDERPPIKNALVLVRDGRITSVGRRAEREIPADMTVVDASDGWVTPGLIEGHAHLTSFASAAYHPDATGPYYDAPPLLDEFAKHGVTTIRDTGGPELGALRTLQTHDRDWPRLFGSGPNLDGLPGGPWKGMWKTDSVAEAVEFVAREADAGVDFIKVYAWMPLDMMAAVVEAAHRRGLRVAAHVGGQLVTARDAVRVGVDALEHIRIGPELLNDDGLSKYAALEQRPRDAMADTRYWRYIDPDGAEADDMIAYLIAHGTYLTPTFAVHEAILRQGIDHSHAPAEVTAAINLHRDATSAKPVKTPEEIALGRVEMAAMLRFVGRAHDAGVRICAGSDTPSGSVTPGLGIHLELELLVEAGLSPLDALRAGTGRTAALLGRAAELGTVTNGCRADLLVLDADPLTDITATRKIRGVFRDGLRIA
ncbi:amidohydrolase family protein [Catenuloplanes japonicus]|uniref:amidohydrolase family protein n=1 Tax=Catenuloplanes japonicus TaxID=33876 RepID=UPI0005256950|nr:amidohydrolase family protein [Catenuloplanes japonicus]